MSYEKLNLTDYISKWTAAHVNHLESGIVANELAIAEKQDMLQNGVNIKSIDNTSLLGSGNLDLSSLGYVKSNELKSSNWDINNVNEDGYIYNRPFYSEYETETIKEATSCSLVEGGHSGAITVTKAIENNALYKITFDNIIYYRMTNSDGNANYYNWIGNGSLITNTRANTNEIFAIAYTGNAVYVYGPAGNHTFSIEKVTNEIIHSIDKKYLPAEVFENQDDAVIIDLDKIDNFIQPENGESLTFYSQELVDICAQLSDSQNVYIKTGYNFFQMLRGGRKEEPRIDIFYDFIIAAFGGSLIMEPALRMLSVNAATQECDYVVRSLASFETSSNTEILSPEVIDDLYNALV